MIYLITDTHLGHQNMLKSCGRPAAMGRRALCSAYRITEQQAETVRSESSPFAFDIVLCWFRLAPI